MATLSTASRNATSQAGRIGIDVLDERIEVLMGSIDKMKTKKRDDFVRGFQFSLSETRHIKAIIEQKEGSDETRRD